MWMKYVMFFLVGVLLTSGCGIATVTAPQPISQQHDVTAVPTVLPTATNAPAQTSEPEQIIAAQTYPNESPGELIPTEPLAPPISSQTWINSQPLEWNSLRGKVVMVEFWTFDCINCRHVIPYLRGMYDSYRDKGFTLIGVHSPELNYERVLANVQDAVKKMGLQYPIAIDNDFANWNRYHNLYWPAIYLVDKRGVIRYSHIGEGGYEESRAWIEKLIQE
jgi:thiol-disulfide isomerase/thioredoxin